MVGPVPWELIGETRALEPGSDQDRLGVLPGRLRRVAAVFEATYVRIISKSVMAGELRRHD